MTATIHVYVQLMVVTTRLAIQFKGTTFCGGLCLACGLTTV